MSDICAHCGQTVPEPAPTNQIDVIIRAKIAPDVVVTRGHIYDWVTRIVDEWYSQNTYDAVQSGELINVSVARQEPNTTLMRRG